MWPSSRLALVALAAIVLLGVGLYLLVSNLHDDSREPAPVANSHAQYVPGESGNLLATVLAQITPEAFVRDRLEMVGEPLGGAPFTTFEEAEQRAGYPIPRPSNDYTLRDGLTYLETFWQPTSEGAPISRSWYETSSRLGITLEIVPSTYDVTDSRSKGVPTTIGSKLGWMLESTRLFYAWKCGMTSSGADLYCTVLADAEVTREEFDKFVASVEYR